MKMSISEQEIIDFEYENENPLEDAEEFIVAILEKNGYFPEDDTSVYRKYGSPIGFVFVPLEGDEVRSVWDSCFIESSINTGNAIYVTACLDDTDLLGQIRCLEGTKTENSMIGGLPLEKKYIRVRLEDGESLTVPATLTDDVYLGLGMVDENKNVLPGRPFRDAKTIESLLGHPRLISAVRTIQSAQTKYSEMLNEMRRIATARNDEFYDGRQDIRMQGAITTPLPDGRHIVTRLSTVTCSEKSRHVPEIDGNVYITVKVVTPYSGGAYGLRATDEIPAYMKKTTKETLPEDVSGLIEHLKAEYRSQITKTGAYELSIPGYC